MTLVADPLERTLLPFRHLHWRSTAVAMLAAAGPICAVTIWLALNGGHLLPALAMTLVIAVATALLSWRTMGARVVLEQDGLRYSALLASGVHVSRGRIKRAVIRRIHAADGRRVTRHLFLLDAQGRTVYRMDDRWWTEEQIGRVARHFEVPLEALPDAVHLSELRRAVPHQLRWDEQHAFLARVGTAVGGAAICLVVGALAASSL